MQHSLGYEIMRELLVRLWNDDNGAVVSVEILLIVSILIFGLIPGLVAMRNSMNSTLVTLGNLISRLVPGFRFSGFAISAWIREGDNGNGNGLGRRLVTIIQFDGFEFNPLVQTLTSDQTAPVIIPSSVVIPPAP